MSCVWVIDDEAILRDAMAEALRRAGHRVEAFASARPALERLGSEPCDLVITDLRMPDLDGIAVLEEARRTAPDVPVLVVTAHGTVESAVGAMKKGAYDYILKPFRLEELEALVERALAHRRLEMENEVLRARVGDAGREEAVWGPVTRGVLALLERAARSDATVLITGESGTGKEVAARTLHRLSRRGAAPFLCVNCAALSAGLLESELFGHEKGAFTGADRLRKGRFELADGGTLLLDEVSEIDPALQAKLLRVLQERAFERVGSSRTRRVDVRVVATTNRDLPAEVARGRFREDLYYRLNVLPVRMPALRERREEIPLLVEHFTARHRKRVSPAAMRKLCAYDWPGNVRELANLLERAAVLCPGEEISAEMIAPWLEGSARASSSLAGISLEELERRAIEENLRACGGNRERAARILGISARTLRDKLKKWGSGTEESSAAPEEISLPAGGAA
ncbi:MAG TPA: sigma-54 dependent transcriptional regulator [Planctomycetota bacterium]|jgi:DNA-binding NtrC family response regulator|nr:sigma-54 dependent transcriptional regulator [Planctomycetota bacterium]